MNATIQGLKDGTVDTSKIDAKEEKYKKEHAAKEAKKAAAKAEAEAKMRAKVEERKRLDDYKEQNREKLEELKENYYLRKARRERWVEFRESNRSKAFTDYYKGWDLFEEDPDEELFDSDNPAAVQDQSAFDAMAQDIAKRTKDRAGSKAACDKERERANLAFKAAQYSEALAGYSRAVEHFKGDKASYSNRAACHIKLRNFLSALEDCSRVMEISRFLDDDAERRPPPPPLLKAYVRRAAAQSELGRYAEAAEDLATALAMAPEAERAEIKRQQKVLKEDMAAAKHEAAVEEAARKAAGTATGGSDDAGASEMRGRVRDLLAEVRKQAEESAKDMDELVLAAEALSGDAAATGDLAAAAAGTSSSAEAEGATSADPRVRAANAALRRGKSEAAAGKALGELTTLARDSAACRMCIRHAGGVQLLLSLLAKASSQSSSFQAAAKPSGGKATGGKSDSPKKGGKAGSEDMHLGRQEAAAAVLVWASSVAKLLCLTALERRNQLEVHICGGSTQVLRELRRLVEPLSAVADAQKEGKEGAKAAAGGRKAAARAASSAEVAGLATLAQQLRLLALCCGHEKVAAEVTRLAAGEDAHGRLIALLLPAPAGSAPPPVELVVAATATIAALSTGGATAKQPLVVHAKPLCAALTAHVEYTPSTVHIAEQAATAFGNLSTHSRFRKEMVEGGALGALLRLVGKVPRGEGHAIMLPNALAAIHNCTLHPDGVTAVATEETATAVLPYLEGSSVLLTRRAAAVMAKCAARHAAVVTMLLGSSALPGLVQTLATEGAAFDAAKDAPRIVELTPGSDGVAEAEEEEDSEEAAQAEEEMVGSAVRILTACAARPEGAAAVCDGVGLPALVKLLGRNDTSLRGNAALCIAECAKDARCLAVLAALPVVQPLLDIAHNGSGGTQKNAAIALGRLAKNPRCLTTIRDNHGIEILARAMKGKMSGL